MLPSAYSAGARYAEASAFLRLLARQIQTCGATCRAACNSMRKCAAGMASSVGGHHCQRAAATAWESLDRRRSTSGLARSSAEVLRTASKESCQDAQRAYEAARVAVVTSTQAASVQRQLGCVRGRAEGLTRKNYRA